MKVSERAEIIQAWSDDRIGHGPSLKRLSQIDDFLSNVWGISYFPSLDNWERKARKSYSKKEFEILKNHQDMISAYSYILNSPFADLDNIPDDILAMLPSYLWENPSRAGMAKANEIFFEAWGVEPALGLLHSKKRQIILDLLSVADSLIQEVRIEGQVLDLGCNAGYHAHWLTQHNELNILGIDTCKSAIKTGIQKISDKTHLKLVCQSFESLDRNLKWDLILDFDTLHNIEGDHYGRFLNALEENGVMITTMLDIQDAKKHKILREVGCEVLFYEVVGGFNPLIQSDYQYLANSVAIVHKNGLIKNPDYKRFQHDIFWNSHFRDYANSPTTQPSQKTQYYCKANIREGIYKSG